MGLPKFALVDFFADDPPSFSIVETNNIEQNENDTLSFTEADISRPSKVVLVLWAQGKGKERTIGRHPAKVVKCHDERDVLETAQKAFETGGQLVDGKRFRTKTKRFLESEDENDDDLTITSGAPPSKAKVKKLKKAEDQKTSQTLKEVFLNKIDQAGVQAKSVGLNAADKLTRLIKETEKENQGQQQLYSSKNRHSRKRNKPSVTESSDSDSSDTAGDDSDEGDDTFLHRPSTTMGDLRSKIEVLQFKYKRTKKELAYLRASLQSAADLKEITTKLKDVSNKLVRQVSQDPQQYVIRKGDKMDANSKQKTTLSHSHQPLKNVISNSAKPVQTTTASHSHQPNVISNSAKPVQTTTASHSHQPNVISNSAKPVQTTTASHSPNLISTSKPMQTTAATVAVMSPNTVLSAGDVSLREAHVTEKGNKVVLHSKNGVEIEMAVDAWSMLKSTPTISRFVGDLLLAALGLPYIQTHSLTGKRSSKSPAGQPLKPAAEKSVIKAITDIAQHFYPGQEVKNSHFTLKFNNCQRTDKLAQKPAVKEVIVNEEPEGHGPVLEQSA